jgi:hypothetical protein
MLSAEELLRSTNIRELRRLVVDLDGQAGNKKAELQTMVASKYHDFIQSADSIKSMQTKAEGMNSKLGTFLQSSQNLVARTAVLQNTSTDQRYSSSSSKLASHSNELDEVFQLSASSVWFYLENCIVSKAAVVVCVVSSILQCYGGIPVESSISTSLPPKVIAAILNTALPQKTLSQYKSITFLSHTVRDDAYLFSLLKNNSAAELSDCLCVIGLIDSCDYTMLLDILLKGRDKIMQIDTECSSKDIDLLRASLTNLVRLLQKTVLDVYFLFIGTQSESISNQGYLALSHKKFADTFRSALSHFIAGQTKSWHSDDNMMNEIKSILGSADIFRAFGEGKKGFVVDQNYIKSRFHAWLLIAIDRVVTLTERTLAAADSTYNVSTLQQYVWKLSINMDLGTNEELTKFGYTQRAWEDASAFFLSPLRKRKLDLNCISSQLLWTHALRQPFLHHVEQLLRVSCNSALERVKEHTLQCLQSINVSLNPETLGVVKRHRDENCHSDSIFTSTVESALVFHYAEEIRQVLESELEIVFGNAHTIKHMDADSHDPQASAALQHALVVQCAQFASQLSIFLRTIAASLRTFLRGHKGNVKNVYEQRCLDSFLNGLLIIGRLAWMLKNRGGMISRCLSGRHDIEGSSLKLSTNPQLTSEQQFRSAFDIADSNGDGCLSYAESLEAIQALSISTNVLDLSLFNVHRTPSTTYHELALLCTNLLHGCNPQAMFVSCLDELSKETHSHWIDFVLSELKQELNSELFREFGPQSKSSTFLSLWNTHNVELDAELGEAIRLPASPSSALLSFFQRMNFTMTSAGVSIDTVQEWSIVDSLGLPSQPSLALYIASMFSTFAANFLRDSYLSLASSYAGMNPSREEQCALQILLDLNVAANVFNRCNINPSIFNAAISKFKDLIDPINAELMLPLLRKASKSADDQSMFIFPCFRFPELSQFDSNDAKHSLQGVFSAVSSSRFSLLPLAMTSAPSWSTTGEEYKLRHLVL